MVTPDREWRTRPHRRTLSAAYYNCGKAANMISEALKRKLRGFPTNGLGLRVVTA